MAPIKRAVLLTFYPILLLNVNPSHISLPRDFDISRKSTKISSYNGDGHRYQKISVISVQCLHFSFDIFTFITIAKTTSFTFLKLGRLVKVRKAKVSCVCSLQEFLDFLSSFVEFNRSPYAFLPRFWTYNVVFLLLCWVPISLARCVSIFFINYYFTFNDILLAIWIYYFNTLLINITKQFIKFTKWTSESRYFLKLIFESSLFLLLIKHCIRNESIVTATFVFIFH